MELLDLALTIHDGHQLISLSLNLEMPELGIRLDRGVSKLVVNEPLCVGDGVFPAPCNLALGSVTNEMFLV